MKVRLLLKSLFAVVVCFSSQPIQGQQFYAGFDYLHLDRTEKGGSNRDYLYSDNLARLSDSIDPGGTGVPNDLVEHKPQNVAFSSADLPFDREEAFRAYIGARLCDCARIEASYFWMDEDWDSFTQIVPPADYSLGTQLQNNNQDLDNGAALDVVGIIDTYIAALEGAGEIVGGTARRESDIEGFEFNFIGRWQNGGFRLDPIFGVRGFSLREVLDMNLIVAPGPQVLPDVVNYSSRADNFIMGLQAGGDLGYTIYGCDCIADFGVFGKAGMGFNSYDHEINITNVVPTNFATNAPSKSDLGIAQFAEFGGRMSLTWRCWEVHAGYQAVLINGVELGGVPPDMWIAGADIAPADDFVMYHGFFGGTSITF
ncbi:MAG: hypothetical protein R3C05_28925 [Pirellulaceae bacterium]